jgi:hypothetical protein
LDLFIETVKTTHENPLWHFCGGTKQHHEEGEKQRLLEISPRVIVSITLFFRLAISQAFTPFVKNESRRKPALRCPKLS